MLNAELRALVADGATFLQIDEPYLSGYPDDVEWVVDVWNTLLDGVEARTGLHICYGNRYGKPSWEGSYRYLFPHILDANVDQLLLEFARKGTDDLGLLAEFPNQFELGMGVVDVKDNRVEAPGEIAARIRQGLEIVPAERLWLNPDCGLRHLPPEVAYAKLEALAQGAALVREELGGPPRGGTMSEQVDPQAPSRLARRLRDGQVVVTAEINPPRHAGPSRCGGRPARWRALWTPRT